MIIVKPTYRCNSRCVYCLAHESDAGAPEARSFSPETLTGFLVKMARENRSRRMDVLWHGGEPLLMGREFYEEAGQRFREAGRERDIEFTHRFQTNLTLLSPGMAETLIKAFGRISLSTSYDPIPGIRRLGAGGSYNQAWFEGAETAGAHGLQLNMVYVIHRGSLGRARDLLIYFKNLGLSGRVRFNPVFLDRKTQPGQANKLGITPEEYGHFLLELLQAGRDAIPDGMWPSPLEEWRVLRDEGRNILPCNSGGGCNAGFLGVSPAGDLHPCGRTMDVGLFNLGNIRLTPPGDIPDHPDRRKFLQRREKLRNDECGQCDYWDYCGGGCPVDAHLEYDDFSKKTPWCKSHGIFFKEFLNQ